VSELTVGSLFAGIGGFDLGLERAGMRSVWQCEIDPYCQRVLAKHWPDVLRVPDIRDVGPSTVPYVDVLAGGFPCQGLSNAGLRLGLNDSRSGLWFEYARVIRELRPRYVLVENVAALLHRGFDRVLGDLAACGYDAEWDCIPASAVGAPHRRDRVWLVAYPDGSGFQQGQHDVHARQPDAQRGGTAMADTDKERRDGRAGQLGTSWRTQSADGGPMGDTEGHGRRSRRARRPDPAGTGQREPVGSLQDADERALQPWRVGGRIAQAGGSEWWAVEPPVGRVAHGVPDRLGQLAALGNALVPQIAEWIGTRIVEWEQEQMRAAA
jgi:DNA (cytosine-5)-methyltransferase 1